MSEHDLVIRNGTLIDGTGKTRFPADLAIAGGRIDFRFFDRAGVPLIEGALAHFVVRVIDAHPAGDHTLYIGRVEHFEWNDDKPLLFYAGRYRHLRAEKGAAAPWEQDDFSLFSIGGFDPPVG